VSDAPATKVIDLRAGGRLYVTEGDEEIQLEVGDGRGGFVRTWLAPDEVHQLVKALTGDDFGRERP
jgi:hypothetical protein